jgi:uncharacterized protein YdeI (YjbR/CyaY-like superfamily)
MMVNKIMFRNRNEWRRWLQEHHNTESEIWLVYYKAHVSKESIRYAEAVEEALCFGWIDSQVRRIDDEKFMQRYTPRKEDSNWSASNKARVQKLIRQGMMTPAGLDKIKIAKRNKSWDRLTEIESEMRIPDDLAAAFSANPTAMENYNNLAPSHKKQYLWWLKSAKRASTRQTRIREIIARLEANIKPG